MENSGLKPFDYFDFLKSAQTLAEKHPFITLESIGKSVLGKEILSFTVGVAEEYVLLVGGISGRESFSSSVLFAFISELCLALKHNLSLEGLRVRRAMVGRAVIIIPSLNPDGCEIVRSGNVAVSPFSERISASCGGDFKSFKGNARGVDLKHNLSNPTEPETAALLSLIKRMPIRHSALISGGNGDIYLPPEPTERALRMAEILSASTGYPHSIQAEQKDFFKAFEKENIPSFKILTGNRPVLEQTYHELRELLMLISIM